MIKFILLVVGLILLFLLLAKVIVEYVPRKIHWIISLFLLVTAGYLGYKIYYGVIGNIEFHQEKEKRFAKVINNLKIIRKANLDYRKAKGVYTNNFDSLVKFIKHDSFPEISVREEFKTVIDRGVSTEVEFKVVDTIGFTRVIDGYKGINFEKMMYVPGLENVRFQLDTASVEKGAAAIKTSVFEAKIDKKMVLEGMDKNLIAQEITVFSVDQVRGEYISVGNLENVKDSGNWPPSYDKSKESSTK